MRNKPKYVIKKAKNGEFHFVLKAPNGKVILQSELYKSKQSAEKGINAIKQYANAEVAPSNARIEK